jgi:hypothetical protein
MICLLASTPAVAHPVPFSYVDLRIQRDIIDATLVVHIFDAAHDLHVAPAERLLDADTLRRQTAALTAMLAPRFTVTADGRALVPTWLGVEPLAERQSLRVHLTFPLGATPGAVQMTARMFPYDPQHQTFVNIYDGATLAQGILDAGHERFEHVMGTTRGTLTVIRRLVPSGIEHILIGPDHVLFLGGRLDPATGLHGHGVHGGAQHHPVARRAESPVAFSPRHRTRHRAEHRLRRRRQPAGP